MGLDTNRTFHRLFVRAKEAMTSCDLDPCASPALAIYILPVKSSDILSAHKFHVECSITLPQENHGNISLEKEEAGVILIANQCS